MFPIIFLLNTLTRFLQKPSRSYRMIPSSTRQNSDFSSWGLCGIFARYRSGEHILPHSVKTIRNSLCSQGLDNSLPSWSCLKAMLIFSTFCHNMLRRGLDFLEILQKITLVHYIALLKPCQLDQVSKK
jgi:hypothetical protein